MKRLLTAALLTAAALSALAASAAAADYSFTTESPKDFYKSTSYEAVHGAKYNYGGPNVGDTQLPALEYGAPSAAQSGVMERIPISQSGTAVDGPIISIPENGISGTPITSIAQQPLYTDAAGMRYHDGSLGTIQIPSLKIDMKVWEGETSDSMAKGLGHYSTTSAWNGNVGVCGHNRGAKYVIGSIKDLKNGDLITYTTIYGARTYRVSYVGIISSTDWSYLQPTMDNRLTLTTCLVNQPTKRVCVQAVQVS